MNVSKEISRLEKSSVKLSITVGKEDVLSEYDELLGSYSKTIQIPGFRKGKVPRDVLVRKFGDVLKAEAAEKIVQKAIENIFNDETVPRNEKPLPYSAPHLEDEPKLDFENDFRFSVIYDVLPEVKVGKWEGLEVEIPDVSVGEEDIARELEGVRDRNSIVLDKNDGEAAEDGDVLTVNYSELDDSGEVLEGGERQDFTFTLGSGYNIYQFDDEIKGMKKGDTREFSKTYAEDHSSFPGETKKLRVNLSALKMKKLPDLDDDLAQDVDEKFKTLDDLKNSIRERLEKELEHRKKDIKINKLLEKIMDTTPVEIPESMIRLELDSRWRNLARRFNTDSDGLYKIMGGTAQQAESIIEGWKPDAERALHSRMIVETLIEELKLEADDDDAEKEIARMAEESGAELDEVKKYYEEAQMKEYLKEDIKERKFFDILLEKNKITTGEKETYLEFISGADGQK